MPSSDIREGTYIYCIKCGSAEFMGQGEEDFGSANALSAHKRKMRHRATSENGQILMGFATRDTITDLMENRKIINLGGLAR